MDASLLEATLTTQLAMIRQRLDHAFGAAKAAEACATAGNLEKAIEIALDMEQPVYEVTTLLNAASLMNRIGRS